MFLNECKYMYIIFITLIDKVYLLTRPTIWCLCTSTFGRDMYILFSLGIDFDWIPCRTSFDRLSLLLFVSVFS